MLSTVFFLIACSSTPTLTIFYDESHGPLAVKTAQYVEQNKLAQVNLELKDKDFYHDFFHPTIIEGANTPAETIANFIYEQTQSYPTLLPVTASTHKYRLGHFGLYLLKPFSQPEIYSCVSQDGFYELEGKIGQSPLIKTDFGESEYNDTLTTLNYSHHENGRAIYKTPEAFQLSEHIAIQRSDEGQWLLMKNNQWLCNFNQRYTGVYDAETE